MYSTVLYKPPKNTKDVIFNVDWKYFSGFQFVGKTFFVIFYILPIKAHILQQYKSAVSCIYYHWKQGVSRAYTFFI